MSQDLIYVAYLGEYLGGDAGLRCVSLNADENLTFRANALINDSGNGAHFPHLVAERNSGRLFVVFHDLIHNDIRIDYSDMGGVDWHTDRFVGDTPVKAWFPFPPAPGRFFYAVPSVAIAETGPHPGRVFVSYTTSPSSSVNENTNVIVRYSDNPTTAQSWTTTFDTSANTKAQFHSWVDVDPMTGVPFVNWLDCRDDPNTPGIYAKRYATTSTDGGDSWLSSIAISEGASFAGNSFSYGDYNANDAFGGMGFDAWPDNSNSTGNNYDGTSKLDIYTDRAILTGHVITVTGSSGPDTYHVQMDASGNFVKIWENTTPTGTPTFTIHRDALKGLIFDLGDGTDVIFLAPAVLDYLTASSDFLDAGDNYMIVDYTGPSPITSLQSLLKSGRNNGTWDGNGIRSSTAAAAGNTALGYVEATDLYSSFPATFANQSVDNTTVLVKYTYYGDTDLNGNVNLQDFNRLAANFGQTGRLWFQGDFNYDTIVNLADFNLLASNWGEGAGAGAGGGTYGDTVWDLRYHLLHGGHGLNP